MLNLSGMAECADRLSKFSANCAKDASDVPSAYATHIQNLLSAMMRQNNLIEDLIQYLLEKEVR